MLSRTVILPITGEQAKSLRTNSTPFNSAWSKKSRVTAEASKCTAKAKDTRSLPNITPLNYPDVNLTDLERGDPRVKLA